MFFFFSSRRRHTRFSRDWSSDVCFPIFLLFKSTRIEKKDAENFILHGDLTIRDVTKPIALDVEMRSEERRVGKESKSMLAARHIRKKRMCESEYGLNSRSESVVYAQWIR